MNDLLAEVSVHYEKELRQGTVDMMINKPSYDKSENIESSKQAA